MANEHITNCCTNILTEIDKDLFMFLVDSQTSLMIFIPGYCQGGDGGRFCVVFAVIRSVHCQFASEY